MGELLLGAGSLPNFACSRTDILRILQADSITSSGASRTPDPTQMGVSVDYVSGFLAPNVSSQVPCGASFVRNPYRSIKDEFILIGVTPHRKLAAGSPGLSVERIHISISNSTYLKYSGRACSPFQTDDPGPGGVYSESAVLRCSCIGARVGV